MSIKMIAIAPYGGCAFVIMDEALYLLRPPYRTNDLVEATEEDLLKAVAHHGFAECNYASDTMVGIITYLKDKYVAAMEKEGVKLADPEELKELLHYASVEVLQAYLDKAENDFLANHNLDAAEEIALHLIAIDKVVADETLFQRSREILGRCKDERKKLRSLAI